MPVSIGNLRSTWANSSITYTGLGLNVNASSYDANSSIFKLSFNDEEKLKLTSNGELYVSGFALSGVSSNSFIQANAAYDKANAALANATGTFEGTLTIKGNTVASNIIISGGIRSTTNNSYGSSGQVLTSNGSAVYWSTASVAANVQTFTASGTWYKPVSGSMIKIQLWGAGGSGASRVGRTANTTTAQVVSGGGGGAYREYIYPLSDFNSTETVTIGAGGAAITSANTDGNSGGSTTFGSLDGAGGGSGGKQDRKNISTGTFSVQVGLGGDNKYFVMAPHITGANSGALGFTVACGAITSYLWANTSNVFFGGAGGGSITQYGSSHLTGIWQFNPATSVLGGNGGNQGNTANGIIGSEPGGGGGAGVNTSSNTYVMASGAGANGKAIITVW